MKKMMAMMSGGPMGRVAGAAGVASTKAKAPAARKAAKAQGKTATRGPKPKR